MSEGLERVAQRAKEEPKCRFTALAHHLTEDVLRETWQGLNRKGAPGVDRVTASEYAAHLDENLKVLVEAMKRHYYRAPHVRRVYIPKAGNPKKLRPLGVPTIQDRLLQAAVARILSAIYEADFLDCSYGFRPGRTAHQALASLRNEVMFGGVQWVYEADIRGFFDLCGIPCGLRSDPIRRFGGIRSMISVESDHRFRSKTITRFGAS